MPQQARGLSNRSVEHHNVGQSHRPNLGLTVGRLEGVGDEVRLMRVVEGRDRELELVRDLPHTIELTAHRTKRLGGY